MNKYKNLQITELKNKLQLTDSCWPLLVQALTHPTFYEGHKMPAKDNQRLEFLGDAILDFLVGEYLFNTYPSSLEGDLTKMRALIVCEASLAAKAAELGLDKALRLGKGAEIGGDRHRPSILADALEAVIGAIYLGMGMDAARSFVVKQFSSVMDNLTKEDFEDKKSLLQEIVQKYGNKTVYYKVLDISGPDHDKQFVSAVCYDKVFLGQGKGKSKKESEQAAAAEAWLNRESWLKQIR
ncbi:MAG: ribonuclease III [Bacillota bacterium]|jgi:ribonuclease-3